MNPGNPSFKDRLASGERMLGTFLKSPSPHATEILGDVGFDFVVVDAEHAPFGRADIDLLMLAARAAGIAGLVRVQSARHEELLTALDCGAAGVLVPHISSAEMLRGIVADCRYRDGRRGFSNSPRAGGYGRLGFADHIARADRTIAVLAMIEDPEALDDLDGIFSVEGLAGAFIGRGDLSARFGAATVQDPMVSAAVDRIAAAAARHGVPLLAHVGSVTDPDVAALTNQGVTAFIVASDQGLLRQAARAQRASFTAA